jgi:hypothetical protein
MFCHYFSHALRRERYRARVLKPSYAQHRPAARFLMSRHEGCSRAAPTGNSTILCFNSLISPDASATNSQYRILYDDGIARWAVAIRFMAKLPR